MARAPLWMRVPGRDGLALCAPGIRRNHAPVAEHLRRELAEIEKARQEEHDYLLGNLAAAMELAGVHYDDCGEAIRAEDDVVENLRARTMLHVCVKDQLSRKERDNANR